MIYVFASRHYSICDYLWVLWIVVLFYFDNHNVGFEMLSSDNVIIQFLLLSLFQLAPMQNLRTSFFQPMESDGGLLVTPRFLFIPEPTRDVYIN